MSACGCSRNAARKKGTHTVAATCITAPHPAEEKEKNETNRVVSANATTGAGSPFLDSSRNNKAKRSADVERHCMWWRKEVVVLVLVFWEERSWASPWMEAKRRKNSRSRFDDNPLVRKKRVISSGSNS